MKYINWNPEKNEILKRKRGISFEEIAYFIESEQIIAIEDNPGRVNQKLYLIELNNYIIVVPYVETENEVLLLQRIPH